MRNVRPPVTAGKASVKGRGIWLAKRVQYNHARTRKIAGIASDDFQAIHQGDGRDLFINRIVVIGRHQPPKRILANTSQLMIKFAIYIGIKMKSHPAIFLKLQLPIPKSDDSKNPPEQHFPTESNILRQRMLDPNYAPAHNTFFELD